ncbi:MAG: CaiB/BaiF CoA-transferase family protein [Thermodesulfobacteriota bacterium]
MNQYKNSGPLNGIKILDFTSLLPGPFATLYLADMGATVLRVTSGTRPDPIETRPPFIPQTEISALWAYLGRGKQSINLNLKNPKAVRIVEQLIAEYDVVIEQYRPGVMAKLGLDYESLKKVNPAVIYCSLTGYGQTGPLSKRAGHDINYLSLAGLLSYSGKKETGPSLMGMQIADIASGSLNSVIGLLAAIIHRKGTGEGQYLDISMMDGVMAFNIVSGTSCLVDGKTPARESERLNGGILYDFYETKDGEYMSLGALEPQFFMAFCEAIARPDLISGGIAPENIEKVKSEIREIFRSKTRDEWVAIFRDFDACVEPVLGLSEALNSPQAEARQMVVDLEAPNGAQVRQMANPIKFSQAPKEYAFVGVPSGMHTKPIISGLGYSAEEYALMENEGVFS